MPRSPKATGSVVGDYMKLANKLWNRYRLHMSTFEKMVEAQDGVCAICQNPCKTNARLSVDHCHDTGRIRGLLCNQCNQGLGQFQDNPERLRKAAKYLESAKNWREIQDE